MIRYELLQFYYFNEGEFTIFHQGWFALNQASNTIVLKYDVMTQGVQILI